MSRWLAGSKGLLKRRPLFATVIAFNAALMSLLISGLGATPAYSLHPLINQEGTPDITDNVWLKLYCNVTLTDNPYTSAPAHIAVVLRSTHPESVAPGEVFDTTNNPAVQVLPGAAQHVALATYSPDRFAGVVSDFELHGTNVSSNFLSSVNRVFGDGQTTNGSTTVTSPSAGKFDQSDVGRRISGPRSL